jgi:hypothetical protein
MRRRDVPLALISSTLGASCASSAASSTSSEVTGSSGPNYPRSPQELAASVTPLNYAYLPGRPERYIAPGAVYASLDGTTGTDFTEALQMALDIPNQPMLLGPFNYLFRNLVIAAFQQIIGLGIHHSILVCKPGSTGAMVTDAGGVHGAAHLDVRGVAFYGNQCDYTSGLRLGYITEPFGTEGVLDQILVRDLPAGFPGIDIRGNVGEFGFLVSWNTGGLQLIGTALTATQLECVGCSGFMVDGSLTVCNFGDAQLGALEVEAQATGSASVYLTGNVNLSMLTIAPSPGFETDHLVEIGPSATTWAIENLKLYFKDPPPVIRGGNFKSGTTYFAGNATGGDYGGEGNYLSGLMTHRDQFGFKLQQFNAFTLRMQTRGGVLEHQIGAVGAPTTATNLAACIANASSTPTATPVSSTSFAQGLRVSGSDPSVLIFDSGRSGAWQTADSAFMASIAYNNTGSVYTIIAFVAPDVIGGTALVRLQLALRDAATGNPVSWATALAGEGRTVDVMLLGFLK